MNQDVWPGDRDIIDINSCTVERFDQRTLSTWVMSRRHVIFPCPLLPSGSLAIRETCDGSELFQKFGMFLEIDRSIACV
jgi:hypothetical protein